MPKRFAPILAAWSLALAAHAQAALEITSPATAAGQYGIPFVHRVTASALPAHYTAVGLPAGLQIAPATGVIFGLPAARGEHSVVLTAKAGSEVATSTLRIAFDLPSRWAAFPLPPGAPVPPDIAHTTTAVDEIGNRFTIGPDHSILEILPDGTVLTVAAQERFNRPDGSRGVPVGIGVRNGYVYTTGHLFGTDYQGVIVLAAVGPSRYSFARFASARELGGTPIGVAADSAGNLHVTIHTGTGVVLDSIDTNGRLSAIPLASASPSAAHPYVQSGATSSVAPNGDIYTVVGAALAATSGLPVSSVARISRDGAVTSFLPLRESRETRFGTTSTLTYGYEAVAVDRSGKIFVSDTFLRANPATFTVGGSIMSFGGGPMGVLREIPPTGEAGAVVQTSPGFTALAADDSGLFGFLAGTLYRIDPAMEGIESLNLPVSTSTCPTSMAFDRSGNLFVVAGDTVYVSARPSSGAPSILLQPRGATIRHGSQWTLSVAPSADPGVDGVWFQWFQDGVPIAGAVQQSYTAATAGSYSVRVSNDAGSAFSDAAEVRVVTVSGVPVGRVPVIISQPQSIAIQLGASSTLSVDAVSSESRTYQWSRNGVPIPGATSPSLVASASGIYAVLVTSGADATISAPAEVRVDNRLVNVSSRAWVGRGSEIGIAGFVIPPGAATAKRVLVRAVGPSLRQFGINEALERPAVSIYNAEGVLFGRNDGWGNSELVASTGAAVGAFPLLPGGADAALVLDLPPGAYTAQVSDAAGGTGVALMEVYETAADTGQLVNLSARTWVGTHDRILIGGFVVGGTKSVRVLLRAIGPGLSRHQLTGLLEKPVLVVYSAGSQMMGINTGWSNGGSADALALARAASAAGAFPLDPGSFDCALLLELPPGAYTAQVMGAAGSTGLVLFEAYQLP